MNKDSNTFCSDIDRNNTLLCTLEEDARRQAVACHPGPAQYKCGSCGAMADAPTNVCQPVQLPEPHWLGDGADNFNREDRRR